MSQYQLHYRRGVTITIHADGTSTTQDNLVGLVTDRKFSTRKEAESYWYDGMPGANDQCSILKVPEGTPRKEGWIDVRS